MPHLLRNTLAGLLLTLYEITAVAQGLGADAIERNQLERRQTEHELQTRLDDGPPPQPSERARPDLSYRVTIPVPGTEPFEPQRTVPQPNAPVKVAPSVVNGWTLLKESQRRSLLEQQVRSQSLPEVQRDSAADIRSLQFQRETQAETLGSSILRDSARAMGHVH